MRILLATPTYGVYGGIEVFVMTLADWLQRNTEHEIRVCFKLVSGVSVNALLEDRCRGLQLDYRFVQRGSTALLSNIHWADLVHGNNCSPDITLLSKLAGKPLVLTIHNWFRGKRGLRNRLWYLCSRLADWRTYNSNFVQGTWEPERRSATSQMIPTVSQLPSEQAPFEARRGFFFIARLIENKGLDVLVKAYARADLDRQQWPLYIAGDGPLGAWMKQYITEHAIDGIHVLGFLSEAEKAWRMAHACWLVAPANTREDMGLTPIEARNVAVPAVVTRDGGLPESAGDCALLCEPGDIASLTAALERAAAMPEAEYQLRARRAQQSLREYLRPISVYADIYDRCAGRRRP